MDFTFHCYQLLPGEPDSSGLCPEGRLSHIGAVSLGMHWTPGSGALKLWREGGYALDARVEGPGGRVGMHWTPGSGALQL